MWSMASGIEADELANLKTVGDAVDYIAKNA